jgi:hypothetical protein
MGTTGQDGCGYGQWGRTGTYIKAGGLRTYFRRIKMKKSFFMGIQICLLVCGIMMFVSCKQEAEDCCQATVSGDGLIYGNQCCADQDDCCK